MTKTPHITGTAKAIKAMLNFACCEVSRVLDGEDVNLDQAIQDTAMGLNRMVMLRTDLQRQKEDDGK